MKLSASTRLLDRVCKPFTDELKILKDYGFEAVDYDLNCRLAKRVGDDWAKKAEEAAVKAEALGIEIFQTHLPAVRPADDTSADDEAMRQAIDATKIMGAKYAVFHVANPPKAEDGFEWTAKYYGKHIEYAKKNGVDMLAEIMPGFCRYPITSDALIDCADRLDIGICWDFGHANVMKVDSPAPVVYDQSEDLRKVGKRLKAVHIHDNAGGVYDEHLPPYMGLINWDKVIPVLREIGYTGTMNYEVLPRLVPDGTVDLIAQYLIIAGDRLLSLYNQ